MQSESTPTQSAREQRRQALLAEIQSMIRLPLPEQRAFADQKLRELFANEGASEENRAAARWVRRVIADGIRAGHRPDPWDPLPEVLLSVDTLGGVLEGRQVEVRFLLQNGTGRVLSGIVRSSWGGEAQVAYLGIDAYMEGSVLAIAPDAQAGAWLEVDFDETSGNTDPRFDFIARTHVEESFQVDVAARYYFHLEQLRIQETRSPSNDSVAGYFEVEGAGSRLFRSFNLGDIGEGTYGLGISLGPIDLVPSGVAGANVIYHLSNGTDALVQWFRSIGRDSSNLGTIWKSDFFAQAFGAGWIFSPTFMVSWAIATVLPDCGGPVAARDTWYSGEELDEFTHAEKVHREETHHPGDESPWLCGSNSDYYVTWSIERRRED